MFRCETDQYGGLVFGAFDGIRNWHINTFHTVNLVEQELISAHEERHLRLQQGTPYGAALALLGTSAAQPDDWHHDLWIRSVDGCRDVHETYATFMSVAHVAGGLDTLAGNHTYLNYWSLGDTLHDRLSSNGNGIQVLEFLFHQLMSPRPTLSPRDRTPTHLGPTLDLLSSQTPNHRLERVLHLTDTNPEFVHALVNTLTAGTTIESAIDAMADVLEAVEIPTLRAAEQDTISAAMTAAFNAGDGTHRATMTVRSRPTALDDQLDYIAAEQIRLHAEPLPLTTGSDPIPSGTHPLTLFARNDEQLGPHVWAVLLSGQVLANQFLTETSAGDHFGFLGCDRELRTGVATTPTAFFMPIEESPNAATARLASAGLRTLTMTTLSTLSTNLNGTALSPTEPLFVLVDERIRPFLLGMLGDHTVQWTTVAVTGDRLLHTVVLTVKDGRPIHFIWVATIYTLKPVLEWLRKHPETFIYAGEEYPDVRSELFALMKHLLGTFTTLGAP